MLAARSWVWAPLGIAGSVCLSSSGFVLQTCGLKEGNTVVVCTCAAVTSMVTGDSHASKASHQLRLMTRLQIVCMLLHAFLLVCNERSCVAS